MTVETRYYAIVRYRNSASPQEKGPYPTYEKAVAAGEYELEHGVRMLGRAEHFIVEKRFEPVRRRE